MASTENEEVISDKEDGDEMASLRLLEKKDCAESIEEMEGSSDLNIVKEDSTADDDSGSCEIISKNMEEILLSSLAQEEREIDKQTESDNQDEEMELRWDDDDLDEEEGKNSNELLGEGSLDTSKYPLTLEDKVLKSIEDEEKLLESEINSKREIDSKKSQPDITLDNVFVPKMDHNLNKPDIMLEIPSHELIEFSDDEEDLTNNLEMSPDMETDEKTSANDMPVEEIQADVHKEEIVTETPKEIEEYALEKEAKLAADILTKQLNAMDDDESLITDDLTEINQEINEDDLLQDATQEELSECQTDKTEHSFEVIDKLTDDTLKTTEEPQEDTIQSIEDQITYSCEELLLTTGENESEDLENTDLKSESPVYVPNKITETKSTDDSTSKVISIESSITTSKPTSDILELKGDQPTLTERLSNDIHIDTKISDKASIENEKKGKLFNEPNIDSVIKESVTDPQISTSNELETLQKELEVKNISNENEINTIEKTLQLSGEIQKLQNDPKVDQPLTELLEKPDIELQKNYTVAEDPLPTSTVNRENSPELTMISDESLNETMVELPAQPIDEPKPSTSTACKTKLTMSSDETLNETTVEIPTLTIDEPKPLTSTACDAKLTMSSDESLNETTVELPAQTIDEPKPSTSTALVTKLTMSSDESLNETTVELPAQSIDEPKPSKSTACETKLTMSSDESLNETTIELPAQTIDEPKPSTSTALGTKLTMSSDQSLNETTVELPAQSIDEPKPSTSTPCETKLTMSSDESLNETTIELPAKTIDEPKPSTSFPCETKVPEAEESLTETKFELAQTIDEPKPSTSAFEAKGSEASMFGSMMVQETSKNVPEMTDSLGLLAESSRVMEEDEEQEDDDEGEDEDDFDQDQDDESSNQMTAENSEDSNAQQSETDQLKENTVDKEFTFTIADVATEANKVESMECDVTDTNEDNFTTERVQETNEIDEVVPSDSAKDDKDDMQMDIETVRLSDTSDNEVDTEAGEKTILEKILRDAPPTEKTEKQSPSKTMKLEIVKQNNIMNYVDLEESSSEDDAQETKKQSQTDQEAEKIDEKPTDIVEADHVKEIQLGSLQTSPVESVASGDEEDTKIESESDAKETKPTTTMGLEVFNLDSDDDEPVKEEKKEDTKEVLNNGSLKCINKLCTSDIGIEYYIADREAINFYDADKKKRGYVCMKCSDAVEQRNQELINAIKNYAPLLELSMNRSGEELVEISDSESEDEPELDQDENQIIGEEGAKLAEEMLEQMINETWKKYKMDDRIAETQDTVKKEMERLQKESEEINEMLKECQVATDQLRNELYSTFEPDIRELPPLIIYDTPNCTYSCVEPSAVKEQATTKRSRSPATEIPAKRPAIPLGYAPLDDKTNPDKNMKAKSEKAEDDNTDVAVVKLSAESAPKDLPPPGEITLTPVKVGMAVYAMKNAYGSWMKAKVVEIMPKPVNSTFTMCRVKFDHVTTKNPFKILPARCLAYFDPPDVRMTIGRRVIALFKDTSKREAYYSGIIAEIPNPVNSYRYLIFFDDGYAQYAHHAQTRLVCECSCFVWEEVHPYSREFVRQYLCAYPERPMVRLHAGQNLKTEWRGKWWSARVERVDASLVEVQFLRRERREWIYRGSTRLAPLYLELQAAERARPRAVPRAQPQGRTNMPYVEYTRSDEQTNKTSETPQPQQQQQNEEIRRQRAVAKKSTTTPAAPPAPAPSADNLDNVTSRVVYYTPKNAVKPYKMVPHNCTPKCKRSDVLALKDLRTYNPLAKPLLSGWERQIVRWKGQKATSRAVLYVAPCGRRLRNVRELHTYLRAIKSDMPVDLFDFSPATHCLAEFVLNKCFVGKKDLSHGKENVPVPCVNYYDESLPEFCSYNTERTPTAGVPLNLDPDFLCGCDCEDDCEDKTKCACWKMTLEGARTIGLEGDNIGYVYKRLPEPLPSGIYECNSKCKCKHTCLNRVAQHPLQLKLQVFKTLNRGWGIRALNDVPKGAFLCVYAGNLLTDATANLDGLNEGDEYLAELDYIEVVEQMKEGYEEDIPEDIKKLDKKELEASEDEDEEEEEEEEQQSSEEETGNKRTKDPEDHDFQPWYFGMRVSEFSNDLRKRESRRQKEKANKKEKEGSKKEGVKKEGAKKEGCSLLSSEGIKDEDCITISDDEEVREPSCFTAAAGMGKNEFISKYRSVRSLFGEDEACYIMDAKVQGNIGRYLNHSCSPNVFVQNVFVDTHDPRFPWVAFFALSHIRAGTELTWNYNYDVGSVPGKVLYCHCGASNCRGRLL